ncbi:MAG TPA: aldolase/citrate lyase family protein [Pirellulaceae bacterium]|nr:aldolase/citrate lyase family protein [Pirellulaceae bacterium]
MRTNPVKAKLRRGEPTFGTWISLGDPYATRVLARMGFDWLTVDLEHAAIDWSRAALLFGAIADAGCVPLARVPEGSHALIKRTLDAGAWGIVVPMVDSAEQGRAAIAAAKYPPTGNRSIGGGLSNLNFGATAAEYFGRANDEILVVLQTESPEGIAAAREIYALDGCDAIFIGPNDLRYRMRAADGTFPTDAEHEEAVQQVLAIGKQLGTPTGIHTFSADEALRRAEQGMQFLAIGSELKFLTTEAERVLSRLDPSRATKDLARY